DLPGFQKRLDFMLQEAADIELVFFNGLDFKLLPAAYATYDKHPFTKPGDEIAELESNGETVCISSFKQDGPAKESGARETWQLNLVETFRMDSNKRVLGEPLVRGAQSLAVSGELLLT
ncbi:unnamed protein product, partial [Effrenium voratum]